jgi:RNA polymerase sigma-70 factor (ECF subfamily)
VNSEQGRKPEDDLKIPAAREYGGDPMEVETARLMCLAKHGDDTAFSALARALRGRAFHVAHGLVGSREDAMELTQEALLKTFRARETYREGEPFLPWFHRILRNTCFTFLRKNRRLKRLSLSTGPEDSSGEWEVVDEAPAPSSGLEAEERSSSFWRAFSSLPPRDREILALRHFRELSYQQIASALEIPLGTVMSRLFHARRRMRDALGGILDEVTVENPMNGRPLRRTARPPAEE